MSKRNTTKTETERPEAVLAQMLRDAYVKAYCEQSPERTAAHWSDLAMETREMYEAVARYLIKAGVYVPRQL